ncbi:hypothetical protein M2M59_06580 [Rummeliibacillus sp. G93]|uniref:hypothetical protein n=1 Tax=Rummeliibacillus sp. G93 TaxID=2939494 RepID=UPI00201C2085|nr:hypothetical protein [Rummeliibacillus sp. G93]UQW98674.1 hypothetical protein M2M59_06580 [Rummeliibacillus sp. G93]
MNSQKKEVILSEIAFWKENKLLPEHYCDFLTTLYTAGEDSKDFSIDEVSASTSILAKGSVKMIWKKSLTIAGILLLLIALFYLQAPLVFIPLAISIAAIIGIIILIFRLSPNRAISTTFAYATIALLLFGISIKGANIFFEGQSMVLYGVLIGNCVLWIISGIWLHLIYFLISGGLGLLVLIIYYFI